MKLNKIASGIQHVGIPTEDIKKTTAFYTDLGFEVAFSTENNGNKVAFLQLGNLVIETYQSGKTAGRAGAIDHIAINVTDVQEARRIADEKHLKVIEEGRLPFWDNGVQYFTVLGPNNEKLEFSQYL